MIYKPLLLVMTYSSSYSQNRNIQKPVINTMNVKSKVNSIKIIFPTQGQSIHNDKNLTITGISTYNHHPNCRVSIVLNNVRPYQKVIATGHNGSNDYSTWKFPLSSKYAIVKPGLNRIAAKLTCDTKPTNIIKFYGVDFTSESTSQPISYAQLQALNNTNSTNINKNNTELLSIIGKKEHNKSRIPPVPPTSENNKKRINNRQNIHTTIQTKFIHKNRSSIKPESPDMSSMNGNNGPFVLSLPSIKNNSSSTPP